MPEGDAVEQNRPPALEATPLVVEYGRKKRYSSGFSDSGSTERNYRGTYHIIGSTEYKESKSAALADAVNPNTTCAGRGSATSQPDYVPSQYELRGQLISPSPESSQCSDAYVTGTDSIVIMRLIKCQNIVPYCRALDNSDFFGIAQMQNVCNCKYNYAHRYVNTIRQLSLCYWFHSKKRRLKPCIIE